MGFWNPFGTPARPGTLPLARTRCIGGEAGNLCPHILGSSGKPGGEGTSVPSLGAPQGAPGRATPRRSVTGSQKQERREGRARPPPRPPRRASESGHGAWSQVGARAGLRGLRLPWAPGPPAGEPRPPAAKAPALGCRAHSYTPPRTAHSRTRATHTPSQRTCAYTPVHTHAPVHTCNRVHPQTHTSAHTAHAHTTHTCTHAPMHYPTHICTHAYTLHSHTHP